MRILQLIQRPQLRGAETFAVQISQLHQRAGHEVLFLALFDHAGGLALDFGSLPVEVLSLNESRRLVDVDGYRLLARKIREFQPDIVQANAGDTLKYAVLSRKLFGWPGHLVFRNANKISSFIRNTLQRVYLSVILREVDSVVSVSENCRLDLIGEFPRLASRSVTITIGTPVPEQAVVPSPDLQCELGLSEHEPVLINVGSFVPEKNHAGLLRIFASVLERYGSGVLLLVGDGRLRPELERLTEQLRLTDHVRFLGYRNDVPQLLAQSDLMVMPSFIEGMPGVILEAMMHRVAVVAADVGGISEVVLEKETGRLVAADDEARFASVVNGLLQDPDQLAGLRERAGEFVREKKSIVLIAGDFLNYYTSTIHPIADD